jgi:cholesterol transport system auxiliary component
MMKTTTLSRAIGLIAMSILMAACTTGKPPQTGLFDLGPAASLPAGDTQRLPALALAEVEAPAWLDTQAMFYRLAYASPQQLRPYAGSRWTAPPPELLGQRLKTRIAHAGGAVLSRTDGAADVLTLRVDLDDFTQTFTTPEDSHVQAALRVSLLDGRTLLAQRSFLRRQPAGPDARSGAAALAAASDALISDIIAWLAQVRPGR